MAREDDLLGAMIDFGLACTNTIRTQDEAKAASAMCGIPLSGHGGTDDGIIGATAAVGLSSHGWSGRFIEFGRFRELPNPIRADQFLAQGIQPVTLSDSLPFLPPALPDIQKNVARLEVQGVKDGPRILHAVA